jgi:hypothetical protein
MPLWRLTNLPNPSSPKPSVANSSPRRRNWLDGKAGSTNQPPYYWSGLGRRELRVRTVLRSRHANREKSVPTFDIVAPHEYLNAVPLSTVCSSLCLVLGFARRYCLPLHVAGQGRSTTLQRLDMIDHIAGAPSTRPPRGRARMLPIKGVLGGGCSSYRLWRGCLSKGGAAHGRSHPDKSASAFFSSSSSSRCPN